ncbi:ATP-binding protein [Fodinicola feengrottensis]|uniref:ATP-binding protein n=1 Tax=Fodinicola feengrottensis TaxID=435914 RepID=UPI0013D12B5E|nr:AAA family ATPase [Fodinicola feengrottensis]
MTISRGEPGERRLVGRHAERAALLESLDAAQASSGRTVLLRGEAGIGKSRLAADALAVAAKRGFAVLQARAHPLRAGLAYAPIVEAVRPRLGAMARAEAAQLLAGLDDLGRLLVHPALTVPEPATDPEMARARMFEAVAQLVERIADRRPTVLFVDDLHWADRGSVELLHYLGRKTAGLRLLVLGSYRGDEMSDGLRELATGVRDNGHELALAPLADAAVAAELTTDLLGATPPAELLQAVTERAKGVPLFVAALVKTGGDAALESGQLPVIVRDVVLDRLRRLRAPERRLLEVIAVAGDDGTAGVIEKAWASTGNFQATLGNLLTDGLVVQDAQSYRAAHPLYAEVAYAELTVRERRAMHAALAAALDAVRPDDVLALAPHYLGAGDLT